MPEISLLQSSNCQTKKMFPQSITLKLHGREDGNHRKLFRDSRCKICILVSLKRGHRSR